MTFHNERTLKFMKGHREHKEEWSEVAFEKELRDESYDVWNYANGIEKYRKKRVRGKIIKLCARIIYALGRER